MSYYCESVINCSQEERLIDIQDYYNGCYRTQLCKQQFSPMLGRQINQAMEIKLEYLVFSRVTSSQSRVWENSSARQRGSWVDTVSGLVGSELLQAWWFLQPSQ